MIIGFFNFAAPQLEKPMGEVIHQGNKMVYLKEIALEVFYVNSMRMFFEGTSGASCLRPAKFLAGHD
jgi:hypothetical protein